MSLVQVAGPSKLAARVPLHLQAHRGRSLQAAQGAGLLCLTSSPLRILIFSFLAAALGALNPFDLSSSRGRSRRKGSGLRGRAGASSRHVFRPKAAHRDGVDPDNFCHRPSTSSCFSSQSLYLSERTRYSLGSPPLSRLLVALLSPSSRVPALFRPSSFSSDGFLDRPHVVQLAQAAVDRPALLAPRTHRPRPVRQPQQVSQVSPLAVLRQAACPDPLKVRSLLTGQATSATIQLGKDI